MTSNTHHPICTKCKSFDIELDGPKDRPFFCRSCHSEDILFPPGTAVYHEQKPAPNPVDVVNEVKRLFRDFLEMASDHNVLVSVNAPFNAKDPIALSVEGCLFQYRPPKSEPETKEALIKSLEEKLADTVMLASQLTCDLQSQINQLKEQFDD